MLEQIISILDSGGWVMYPLAMLALLIYINCMELLLFMGKGNIQLGRDTEWVTWVYNPEKATGRAGEIIRYTSEDVRSSKHVRNRFEEVKQSILHDVERRLIFLSTLVAAAPLMGLLGTVIGMLATFSGIARKGGGDTVDVVSQGISEALITTQTGLVIALPGIFLILVIRNRKHYIEAALARIESLVLTKLKLD